MATKSTNGRRTAAAKPKAEATPPAYDVDDEAAEDALAYEHDFAADDDSHECDTGDSDECGLMSRASDQVHRLTNQREGRVVVAALAGGFAIGAAIGCLIIRSRQHKKTWSERLACEGLGRRMLDRLASAVPDSVSEKLKG